MTILAPPATTSAPSAAPTPAAAPPAAQRDVRAWEAEVRRTLRPAAVELVDGSAAQRQRLVVTGLRRGTLRLPAGAAPGGDLSAVPLREMLRPEHRALLDAAADDRPAAGAPAAEGALRARAMRRLTGAARGRTAWLVPHCTSASGGDGATAGALGVLFTDSLVAVLDLLEGAGTGLGALRRIEAGEPWSAAVHSMGLPLDDEHGLPLREDVPWPSGPRFTAAVRGGTEVWSCGSPVVGG
ncbi:hypothetical protein [Quadrisphaera sp. KR29]|uniref:hypothetical protein n=1 Tax=Quadrisphaera sp. KR29 TaxID=3461391 RepID=UPI004044DF12